MRNNGATATQGGAGKFIGGVAVALALSAGAYIFLGPEINPSDEDLTALVPDAAGLAAQSVTETPERTTSGTSGTDAAATDEREAIDSEEAPQSVDEVVALDDPSPEPSSEAETAPTIDEVRLEQDGFAVVAGRAAPGSDVEVVIDDEVIATGQADASGAFAALGVVAPSDQPRVLSLRATEPEQDTVASLDEVILAPVPQAPAVVVQSAEDKPAPDAPQDDGQGFEAASDIAVETEAETLAEADSSDASDPAQTAVAETQTGQELSSNAAAATLDTASTEIEPNAAQPAQEITAAETATVEPETESAGSSTQVALLKSDEDGVTLLQSAPQPPERIVLDTIGYSDSGIVQLAGRANEDAVEVRVYIDNQAFAALPVETGGDWQGDLPDIDTGVYTLRVDAVDAQGDVTSRIETPFKREEPEILAAASSGSAGPVRSITVQTGDTLWAIARERYGEGVLYVQVFEANKESIRDEDLIYPGQVFDLPVQ